MVSSTKKFVGRSSAYFIMSNLVGDVNLVTATGAPCLRLLFLLSRQISHTIPRAQWSVNNCCVSHYPNRTFVYRRSFEPAKPISLFDGVHLSVVVIYPKLDLVVSFAERWTFGDPTVSFSCFLGRNLSCCLLMTSSVARKIVVTFSLHMLQSLIRFIQISWLPVANFPDVFVLTTKLTWTLIPRLNVRCFHLTYQNLLLYRQQKSQSLNKCVWSGWD